MSVSSEELLFAVVSHVESARAYYVTHRFNHLAQRASELLSFVSRIQSPGLSVDEWFQVFLRCEMWFTYSRVAPFSMRYGWLVKSLEELRDVYGRS